VYGFDDDNSLARIQFEMRNRRLRFDLPMPLLSSFALSDTRRIPRTAESARTAWEQACRQRWRALALVIKAKLEAVDSGIVTFEEEFLAHVVLPNGSTVGEYMEPQIQWVYDTGQMPTMLPGLPEDVAGLLEGPK
jgi:hypothetical protein